RLAVHARALLRIRKVDLADQEFRRVADMAPTDPEIRFACFKFQVKLQRLEAAGAELAAVVAAQRQDDAQTRIRAFRVYADNGNWTEARARHQRAIQLAPTDRKIALEHYRYHVDRGEWPQADAAYAEQLAHATDEVELRRECASLHAEARRWEHVYAECAKILPLRRDDGFGVWGPYAVICVKTGRIEEYRKFCAELFERAEKSKEINPLGVFLVCQIAPNPPIEPARLVAYARDRFGANGGPAGHCLYGNGQYDEAVAILAKVVQEPHSAGLIFHKYVLAKAYQELGKYELPNLRLTEAKQAFADEMAKRSVYNQWFTRLNLEMKRDEAKQLVYGKGRHRPAIDSLIARSEWQAALDRLDALAKENELNSRDWTNRGR